MHIVNSLEKAKSHYESEISVPVVLTIGNFEGVHLGHQALLKYVVTIAEEKGRTPVVLTFANHPSEILKSNFKPNLLTTLDHKLKLLEGLDLKVAVLLPFTKEFSEQSAEEFLVTISKVIPFDTLILGSDARIGKNREGDSKTVAAIANKLKFTLDYFPDCDFEGSRISSSRIRNLVVEGDLEEAASMLGRPFSIYGKVERGSGRGSSLGFPTANIAVDKLCLPPIGVYSVTLLLEGVPYPGVANLGNAPTIHEERNVTLEVHLFDKNVDLYEKTVEVQFHTFIRPEMRFDSVESLKKQIAEDIKAAKKTSLEMGQGPHFK